MRSLHLGIAAALLACAATLAAPGYAASKHDAKSEKSEKAERPYLYFRPAAVATSSQPSSRATQSDMPEALSLSSRMPDAGDALVSFAPNGKAADPGKSVALQLRSKILPGNAGVAGAVPKASAYDVNVALAYYGFAIDAGLSRTAEANRILSQGVNLGLSYGVGDWRTRLSVSDQRLQPDPLTNFGLVEASRALAFELGSSYRLSSRWAISGGVRYAIGQPFDALSADPSRQEKSKAVFVGTAFSF